MTNKVDKTQKASCSKRRASISPTRRKKVKTDRDGREGNFSDNSSKRTRLRDGDKGEDDNDKRGKSKYTKSNKNKASKKRDSDDQSSEEEDRSSSQSSSSAESDGEIESEPKEGSRYWGEGRKPPFNEEDLKRDAVNLKPKGRYWGGEPDKDVEEGELSSHSQDVDYEVGKRYYDKPENKDLNKADEKDKSLDFVVGERYYQDEPAERSKDSNNDKQQGSTNAAPTRKSKLDDPLLSRTGGAYIPPAKLRLMQASITDKSSMAYQRIAWEALKKSIHGHINKVNTSNIGIIARLLMKENIVRGRGLLCRSLLQAQAASPTFTNVYASLVSVVNSKFPNISELLMKRVILQFKRCFKRNDKQLCIASCQFIAHLVNQQVAHEILALEMLTLLLESPTDDSVEVAVAFLKEVGQKLLELSPKGTNAIFDMLRNILHQGNLEKRVQYMIEVVFQVRKDGFRSFPSVDENLDLVEEEDRYTHILTLDEATDPEDLLNVFKHDLEYELNEDKYKALKEEIIGGSSSEEESGDESDEESNNESSDNDEQDEGGEKKESNSMMIIDETETNLVALRRTIYLTIQSSLDFEECCHKLLKMDIKPGQEPELCHMLLDCCAELRTYEKFFGLLAQRFCQINRVYITPLEEMFSGSYATVHRLDTNKLRNVARFFGHLLFTDAISWEVLQTVRLNEEETTSSSRIFIKILFQELAEYMGLALLNQRLKDPTLQTAMEGLFPRDNPKNTRFAINFFTSIGLGGLTDDLREHLKTQPKSSTVAQLVDKLNISSDSSSTSDSSDDSSDSSSSESDELNKNEKSKKKIMEKQKKGRNNHKNKEDSKDSNSNKNSTERSSKKNYKESKNERFGSLDKTFKKKEPLKTGKTQERSSAKERAKDSQRKGDGRTGEKDSSRKENDSFKGRTANKNKRDYENIREKDSPKRDDTESRDKDNRKSDYNVYKKKEYDEFKEKENWKKDHDSSRQKDNSKKRDLDDFKDKDNRKKDHDDSRKTGNCKRNESFNEKENKKKYDDYKEKDSRKRDFDDFREKDDRKKVQNDFREKDDRKKVQNDFREKDIRKKDQGEYREKDAKKREHDNKGKDTETRKNDYSDTKEKHKYYNDSKMKDKENRRNKDYDYDESHNNRDEKRRKEYNDCGEKYKEKSHYKKYDDKYQDEKSNDREIDKYYKSTKSYSEETSKYEKIKEKSDKKRR